MDSCYVYRIANDENKYKTKYIIHESSVIIPHRSQNVRRSIDTDTTIISLSKSLLITFIDNKCVTTEYIAPRQNERIGYFSEPKK